MLEYTLIRKNNKNLYLRVKEGKIIVTAPLRASKRQIESFVLSHQEWIQKQLSKQNRCLQSHDRIFILEKEYEIIFVDTRRKVDGSILYCRQNPKIFQNLILQLSRSYFEERFQMLCQMMNISDMKLHLGFYTSKWGSCHVSKKLIKINTNLVFTDKECIDAIFIHELCHLKYMDHSPNFYREVLFWMPDYKEVHRRLNHYEIPYIQKEDA